MEEHTKDQDNFNETLSFEDGWEYPLHSGRRLSLLEGMALKQWARRQNKMAAMTSQNGGSITGSRRHSNMASQNGDVGVTSRHHVVTSSKDGMTSQIGVRKGPSLYGGSKGAVHFASPPEVPPRRSRQGSNTATKVIRLNSDDTADVHIPHKARTPSTETMTTTTRHESVGMRIESVDEMDYFEEDVFKTSGTTGAANTQSMMGRRWRKSFMRLKSVESFRSNSATAMATRNGSLATRKRALATMQKQHDADIERALAMGEKPKGSNPNMEDDEYEKTELEQLNEKVHTEFTDLPWGQRWLSFADTVSIVGLKYAVDPQAGNVHRLIWLALVLTGIGFMFYQIYER